MVERQPTTAPKSNRKTGESWSRLGLLGGLLLAFALRLFHLGGDSLWYDETVSAYLAQKPIPALLAHTAGDIHPPGYYLLLHFWQQLTTPAPAPSLEFLLAWPSLLCGMLLVAITYALGRRLFSLQTALLALGLAAVHPFQIWYSQEVRMYTLGAFLGLLALWSTVQALTSPPKAAGVPYRSAVRRRWLVLYVLCSAAGLYTLYYFLFVVIALNLVALYWLTSQTDETLRLRLRQLRAWALAQGGVLVLWLPWLPIFWRQATEPPVPPWRVPWQGTAALVASLSESVSAMLSGQSAPLATHWFWLLIGVALLIGGTIFARRNAKPGWVIVALYTFLPLAILFGVTLTVTPLYHVRYLMLYAPLFVLWVAAALTGVYQHNRGVALLLALLLVAVNGWSLHRFWSAPQFQSDDHRGAVSRLAEEWRPGDLILVNAGWAYTAIETYWPKVLIGADAALPPPIANVTRLSDYAQHAGKTKDPVSAPLLVRTGSVDGPPSLGWGDPTSDFFAIDRTTTLAALETLSRAHTRIWHYRLYDTVNDPAGLIRQWLADHADLVQDEPITGRDYGRLQLYEVHNAGAANHAAPAANTSLSSTLPITASTTQRGDRQLLAAKPLSTTIPAGQTLYVRTRWQQVDGAPPTADTVSLSLRLYDDRGLLIAQQDSTPRWMSDERTANTMVDLTLALPLPVATQPGSYSLRLLLYEAATGQPLPDHTNESADPLIPLTVIAVSAPQQMPITGNARVTFDYIDLLALQAANTTPAQGGPLIVESVWRPQVSTYRDTYVLQWRLLDSKDEVVQQWDEALGSWHYPSSTWPALLPVRQNSVLPLAQALAPGTYQLQLQFIRHSDGTVIQPIVPWWHHLPGLQSPAITQNGLTVAAIVLVG